MNGRWVVEESFGIAVAAADPREIVPRHLPPPPSGRTWVVGAGKAAAAMAFALESHWPADRPLAGLVVTRYGHGIGTRRIEVVEASHPVPDIAGQQAAHRILALARATRPDDLLIVLISGGGSSLLTLPAPGLTMEDLRATTLALLRSGAPIQEMNVVRKHLSAIQGGRLAAAACCPVLALIISDVTGDEASDIASGPCAPDPSTYADAISILVRHGVSTPEPVRTHLENGARGTIPETPKHGEPVFARVENRVIASGQTCLQAAAGWIRAQGVPAVVLGDSLTGEARDVAAVHAAILRQIWSHGEPWRAPVALLSGGECTVKLRPGSTGRGGRCSEFLLALAQAIGPPRLECVHALACDTDGIDGSESNAGARLGPDVAQNILRLGLDTRAFLDNHDAYGFFERAGGLVFTGPTRTNVNDYRIMLVT